MTVEEAIEMVLSKGGYFSAKDLVTCFGGSEEKAQALIDKHHRKVIEGYEIGNTIIWCDCSVCEPSNAVRLDSKK